MATARKHARQQAAVSEALSAAAGVPIAKRRKHPPQPTAARKRLVRPAGPVATSTPTLADPPPAPAAAPPPSRREKIVAPAPTAAAGDPPLPPGDDGKAAAAAPITPALVSPLSLGALSQRVLIAVQRRGLTTHTGVADDLVEQLPDILRLQGEYERGVETARVDAALAEGRTVRRSRKTSEASGNTKKKTKKEIVDSYEKNIRRRVYDALNVMVAAGVVAKDERGVVWVGFEGVRRLQHNRQPPHTEHQEDDDDDDAAAELLRAPQTTGDEDDDEYRELVRRKDEALAGLGERRDDLLETVAHGVGCRNLRRRNDVRARSLPAAADAGNSADPTSSSLAPEASVRPAPVPVPSSGAEEDEAMVNPGATEEEEEGTTLFVLEQEQQLTPTNEHNTARRIPLPFLIASAPDTARVTVESHLQRADGTKRCKIAFTEPFEINDDHEILKRMGLCTSTAEELRRWVQGDVVDYMHSHRLLDSVVVGAPAAKMTAMSTTPSTGGAAATLPEVTSSVIQQGVPAAAATDQQTRAAGEKRKLAPGRSAGQRRQQPGDRRDYQYHGAPYQQQPARNATPSAVAAGGVLGDDDGGMLPATAAERDCLPRSAMAPWSSASPGPPSAAAAPTLPVGGASRAVAAGAGPSPAGEQHMLLHHAAMQCYYYDVAPSSGALQQQQPPPQQFDPASYCT